VNVQVSRDEKYFWGSKLFKKKIKKQQREEGKREKEAVCMTFIT